MYFKMAYKNVKRSVGDYLIYFLTLSFAVCIFYAFNSMDAQTVMFNINESQSSSIQMLSEMISVISVFISFILGGLIIYANNVLIKKRKKELGLYMVLGMGKSLVSRILIMETFCIGVLALGTGLVFGILISQGLSVVTAYLFTFPLSNYQFVFSMSSLLKTILYFGLIFIMVILFNTWSISKYKLIDLIHADKVSEELPNKKPWVIITAFVVSIFCIMWSYILALKIGLNFSDSVFQCALVLGVVGTFLFFYSMLGFVLLVMMKNPSIYLKGLNPFVLRQIQYKVNTHFVSMSVICLMLLLTLGMLSSGLGFKTVIEKGAEAGTPYDATAVIYYDEKISVSSIKEVLDELNFSPQAGENYVFYNTYEASPSIKETMQGYVAQASDEVDLMKNYFSKVHPEMLLEAIKYSDFKDLMRLRGEKVPEMGNNEVLLTCNVSELVPLFEQLTKKDGQLTIAGKEYQVAHEGLIEVQFYNLGFRNNRLTLIVPDELADKLPITSLQMSVNFDETYKEYGEGRFQNLFEGIREGKYKGSEFILGYTRNQIYTANLDMTSSILFIGIYMGLIFLLSSAALLALQQLSEAGDSKKRYDALKKMGVSETMIRKAIWKQVLCYFMLPLGLAIVHAIVGIHLVNQFLMTLGNTSSMSSSLITGMLLLLIYTGYFLATYKRYCAIIE